MRDDSAHIRPDALVSSLAARSLRCFDAIVAKHWSWRLGATLVALAAALAVCSIPRDVLGESTAYFTFYPAILVASLLFGVGAGLSAAAFAVVATHLPFGVGKIASFGAPPDAIALGVFALNASVLIFMARLARDLSWERRDGGELTHVCAEQLGHFVEQMPAAVAMFDNDMRYLAASAAWRENYGLRPDLVGKSHYDVFPEMSDEWKNVHRRALAGERIRSDEDEFRRRDGATQWVRWEIRPWRHPRDGIGGVMIFSEDISDRVRARQALQESDERLRFALRAAKAGVWEWDPETKANRWSEGIWRLFGLAPESCEPTYEAWMATIQAQDRRTVAAEVEEATRNGRELNVEWRTLDSTGSERWLMLHGGPLRVVDRAASRYMGLVIETTERRRAEQTSRDNERRLNAIVDTAMEAIVSIDRHGRMLSVNPAAREMFGFTAAEMLGRNVSTLMPNHYRLQHDSYIAAYLGSGVRNIIGQRRRVEGRRKDGAVFPLELTVSEATDNNELLFVGFMRDLSPIEEERRRVNALRDELFHVSRLNDMGEVVAGLAHEVGQPIAAILNYSAAHRRAMSLTGEPPEPDVIMKIEAQARRAADILKRLRGFIEKRPPERRVETIQDLIDDALKLTILRSRAHILRPSPEAEEAGLRVCVDRILIGQVLVNLLRNADEAVADEPEPQIWIEISRLAPQTLRVSVADNGAGVDPETVAELFSPFVSTKRLGMGVGLSIGKAIVESHDGAISYRANMPRGSIFEFTLPVVDGENGAACAAPGDA